MASLFSDFLEELHVKHTVKYSDKRFKEMPFQSMFGMAHLLREYGIDSVGVKVNSENLAQALRKFQPPFLLDTLQGFLIVTNVGNNQVSYLSQNKRFTATADEVLQVWNGIALLAEVNFEAKEPDYLQHNISDIVNILKGWVVGGLTVALIVVAMCLTNLASHWAAWAIVVFDLIGILLSVMLVQKSLGIHNKTAESMCSVLEAGGCDEIASSEASSFMGIFKWSEVGLAYFSVSLFAILLFPNTLPVLAAINILCLPYSFWSIWYQKFKAKTWCTLCVCVQATLWILFAFYLAGGWTSSIAFDCNFWITFSILAAIYVIALLGLNLLDNSLADNFKIQSDVKS